VRACANVQAEQPTDPFADAPELTAEEFANRTESNAKAEPPATERQLEYLRSLLTEINGAAIIPQNLGRVSASRMIDEAKARKYAGMEADAAKRSTNGGGAKYAIEDGLYRRPDGTVVLVYHTVHGANRQVAKRLVVEAAEGAYKGSWIYEGMGGKAGLTKDDRLSEEDARELGILYGFCVRCTKNLTREESQFVGYGKTCAGRMGWWYPTKKEVAVLIERQAERFSWSEGDLVKVEEDQ
jgi:hypothetical protein